MQPDPARQHDRRAGLGLRLPQRGRRFRSELPDKVQEAAIERFTSLDVVLARGAANIDVMVAPGESELRSVLEVVSQEVTQVVADFPLEIDDEVLAGAREIPECAGVL